MEQNLLATSLTQRLVDLNITEPNKTYTIDQYRTLLKDPKIFSELPVATQTDLTYHPLKIIPRDIIDLVNSEFRKYVPTKTARFDIAGSYIRGRPTSRDIDLVLSDISIWPDFMKLINDNSKFIQILPPYSEGPGKVTTLIKVTETSIHVKMDVFLTDAKGYMFMLLYAIGSGPFNIRMRIIAKKQGLMLNQHGLYKKDGSALEITDECDVFARLGMIYRTPTERIA